MRAKLGLYLRSDMIESCSYLAAFQRGIEDALQFSYDKKITDLESEFLSGAEEKLCELVSVIDKYRQVLETLLQLSGRIIEENIQGPIVLDVLDELFAQTVSNDRLHFAVSHVLAKVEWRLLNQLGKWLTLGEYSEGFFIVEVDGQPKGEVNLLPKSITDENLERIIFIGSSLLMLKSKKIETIGYATDASNIYNSLILKEGEPDELPMISPVRRINWRKFEQVFSAKFILFCAILYSGHCGTGRQNKLLRLGHIHYAE